MRLLIAPQEFKGTLSAREAAQAMAAGARQAIPNAHLDLLPLADGGPGTLEAILSARPGEVHSATVSDPLGRPVRAEWGLVEGETAVIEVAAAAGLWRLRPEERDPAATTTRGVGELMLAALDTGARRLIVGLGGSATNDGGAGLAQALGARLLDAQGRGLPPGGLALAGLERSDTSGLDPRLAQTEVIAATDVMSPLCGPAGASLLFGPQKGADPETARALDASLAHYAAVLQRDLGVAVDEMPGAGAAGGLGAALIAFLHAEVRPGIEVVGDVVGLEERVRLADLVLTGEGRLDGQTAAGKTVAGVARLAKTYDKPVVVVAGSLGPGWERLLPLVTGVEPIVGSSGIDPRGLGEPAQLVAATTARALAGYYRMKAIV
ncbi:MAG TPA: glycerate kinase [Dehalococcoidia bacterium]|nr:glycerate kinase [Dehalococcoidia bacterium]